MYGIEEIKNILPHREPFLMIDKVIENIPGDTTKAIKAVSANEWYFQGHFEKTKVMPGVLICECCFQAGALLIAHRIGADQAAKGIPVVTRIQDARFRRMVRPGEMLHVEVALDDVLDNAYFMTGRVTVDGKPVVRVTFACMQADAEEGVA